MVSKCAELFAVTLILVNVIQECSGISQSEENGGNSAIFQENGGSRERLEFIHKELLQENNASKNSNEVKDYLREVARKKGGGKEESMMDKILPMLILPFLVSSSMIPAMLLSIKVLMIKSAIIGKIAVILMIMNFFRRRVDTGGVYNHYPMDLAKEHYGYQGVEEPGVYVNKKRRRKRHLRLRNTYFFKN